MTVTTMAVRHQAPATNTTQDFDAPGFGQATALYIYASFGTTEDTDLDGFFIGHGFYDGTNSRCTGIHQTDNIAYTDTLRGRAVMRDDSVVYLLDRYASSVTRYATVSSWTTDKVTLSWAGTQTAHRPFVTVVFIKGASAVVGDVVTSASVDGTVDATTTGITPDLVIVAHVNSSSALQISAQNPSNGIGVAWNDGGSAPYPQYCLHHRDLFNSGGATSCAAVLRSDRVASGESISVSSAEVTAWAADKFTLTTRTSTAQRRLAYLALQTSAGGEIFSATTPTTGDFAPTTSSAEPESILMWTTAVTTVDSNRSADPDAGGSGFWYLDQTNQDSLGSYSTQEDAVASSNVKGRISSDCIIQAGAGGTPLFSADPGADNGNVTWGSTGFSIGSANVSHGASAYYVFGVAFLAAAVTTGGLVMPTYDPCFRQNTLLRM